MVIPIAVTKAKRNTMITIDTREAQRAITAQFADLTHRNVLVANTRAINTSLMKARTAFRKEVRKEYNISSDTLKQVDLKRASYAKPVGEIFAVTTPISLSRFNPKFETTKGTTSVKEVTVFDINSRKKKKQMASQLSGSPKRNPKRGVSVEIKKGERKRLPFAFMVTGGGAGVSLQVWARGNYKGSKFETAKPRLPITPLKSVSPFGAIKNEEVLKPVVEKATKDFETEMQRQVDLMLNR